MRRLAAIAGLCAALPAAGCAGDVHGGPSERARDAVRSFLADCARGRFAEAQDVLTDQARRTFTAAGDPAAACASIVGLEPVPAPGSLGAAAVGPTTVRGDQAEVAVRAGGVTGSAELEDSGQVMRIALRTG